MEISTDRDGEKQARYVNSGLDFFGNGSPLVPLSWLGHRRK
jgi:hypothetical protein